MSKRLLFYFGLGCAVVVMTAAIMFYVRFSGSVGPSRLGDNFYTVVTALRDFRETVGRYPTQDEGLQALIACPPGAESDWVGPYIGRDELLGRGMRSLVYRIPAKRGKYSFEVFDLGLDGVESLDDEGTWMYEDKIDRLPSLYPVSPVGPETWKEVFNRLRQQMENFRADVDRYPTTEEGLHALVDCPQGLETVWRGPYLKAGEIVDGGGRPLRYRLPAKRGVLPFEIFCVAEDGVESNDDIGTWSWDPLK